MDESRETVETPASLLKKYMETSIALVSVLACVAGGILYIAGISSRADAAYVRYDEVDKRLERQKEAIIEQREFSRQLLDRTSRMEGKIDVILQRTK